MSFKHQKSTSNRIKSFSLEKIIRHVDTRYYVVEKQGTGKKTRLVLCLDTPLVNWKLAHIFTYFLKNFHNFIRSSDHT